ncbi:hypothetical protein RJ640_002450 [Escallonia rubra]|uniref:Uncharacterized protein n=1 Tax=Escallonia rubra TaxID=112253 RepID=A0AA88UWF8_9ASTE|nr:hypothetical protein RJ640_002450 [Escallonia rubra]
MSGCSSIAECCKSYEPFVRVKALYHECKDAINQQNKLGAPMPWIGIYIAAVSLICTLLMATDAIQGFRLRKFWFPCNFFTLNATALTSLAIATKLPGDVSDSMPGYTEQLAKLSSTAFICTTMGNFLPSLGVTDNKEILTNVTALVILVITILVNVCIQLRTGAISDYSIVVEHVLIMLCMLILLTILSFSALTVPISKRILELKYREIHSIGTKNEPDQSRDFTVENLRNVVRKYWIMAESGSPQFVMVRSPTCSASGAICFLISLILVEAEIRISVSVREAPDFGSDYKWSTLLILTIQSIGVVVGTIAPAFRFFIAISIKCSETQRNNQQSVFRVENYWIQKLVELKESPLALQIRNQKYKKLVQGVKNVVLNWGIQVQVKIVVASKMVCLISIYLIGPILSCYYYRNLLKKKLMSRLTNSDKYKGPGSDSCMEVDLSHYVMRLEGEDELPEGILKNIADNASQLIQVAKQHQAKNLMKLLEKSKSFMGVGEEKINQSPPLHFEDQGNCWSLSVVTLTSIAAALPNIRKDFSDGLLRGVGEGLLYIKLIEEVLDTEANMVKVRNAAYVVWLGVELYRTWLDKDLREIALKGKTSEENIRRLADIAKTNASEHEKSMKEIEEENPPNLPIKVIAANVMYRISETILEDDGIKDKTDEELFEQLSVMTADILGACFFNLPQVITMKCYCSGIEEREESVRLAARLLGETEEILKILQRHQAVRLHSDQITDTNELQRKQGNPSSFMSSSNNAASSSSNELHVNVE